MRRAAPLLSWIATLSSIVCCAPAPPKSASAQHSGPVTPPKQFTAAAPVAPEADDVAYARDDVVSLRPPTARSEVIEVLERYFDAVTAESNTQLAEILTDDATIRYAGGAATTPALVAWVRRFAQLDYRTLGNAPLFREQDLEMYSPGDAAVLGDHRGFAFTPSPGQLLVRVPLVVRETGQKTRFGHSLELLLERDGTGLRIRALFEDGYLGK